MHRAIRKQTDQHQDAWSDATALNTQIEPDKARSEFMQETDINHMMTQFGVTPTNRQPIFTEVDYNVGLQDAYMAIEQVKEAHRSLSSEVKQLYPTWRELLNAIEAGTFEPPKEPERDPAPEADKKETPRDPKA